MPKSKPNKKPEVPSEPDVDTATEDAPAVIPEETSVITRHVLSSNMGLTIIGDPTFEDWEEIVATYTHVYDKSQWWIGDAIAYGEGKFGEKYAQAVNITGRKLDTLKNIVSVCQRVQLSRRNENLSFKHHSRIAGLPYQTGDELLVRAQREHWNSDELGEEVKKINELAGIPHKPGRKKSIARQVAASGKEPQVPEGEAPLIWNGYPLRVMVMPDQTRVILQGNEPLPTDEADRAAHEFGHAHGPNLAKWLEEHNFRKEGDQPCAQHPISTALPQTSHPAETQTAPSTETQSGCASSGASVVQPDAAPIPQFTDAQVEAGSKAAMAHIYGNPDAPQTAQPASEPVAAPVEPKATPGPTKTPETDAECQRLIRESIPQADGPNMAEFARKMEIERDDAREQLKRYEFHTQAETPIEAAERHIRAFNLASENVDWKAIGASNLLRRKWLGSIDGGKVIGGILNRCDEIIDTIQGTPVTPRK